MGNPNTDAAPASKNGPYFIALIIFIVALWAQVDDAYVGRFLEDGLNLVLAKSLARGDGLTLIHLPDAVPARWIYPLYPFLVSLVGRVWPSFPENLVLIQILDSALLGCAAWIVALQVRKLDVPPVAALVVILLAFSSAAILSLAVSAFAEPFFLVVAASAVTLADRKQHTLLSVVASGLLAGASALTSTLGVFVIAGVILSILVRRRFAAAAGAAAVALVIAVPWFVWSWRMSDPSGLAAVVVEWARQQGNLGGTVSWLGLGPLVQLLLPSLPQWMTLVVGPIAAVFFGVGVWAIRRDATALALVVSMCVLGAWLHPSAVPRNEWILFPWFAVLVGLGAWRVWGYVRRTRIPVLIIVVVLGFAYIPRTVTSLATREFAGSLQEQNELLGLLIGSINVELPEDAIIASDTEAMVHLYTGRLVMPSRRPAAFGTAADMEAVYCDAGVTHIVRTNLSVSGAIDDGQIRDLAPAVSLIFSLTNGPSLYRFTCQS